MTTRKVTAENTSAMALAREPQNGQGYAELERSKGDIPCCSPACCFTSFCPSSRLLRRKERRENISTLHPSPRLTFQVPPEPPRVLSPQQVFHPLFKLSNGRHLRGTFTSTFSWWLLLASLLYFTNLPLALTPKVYLSKLVNLTN